MVSIVPNSGSRRRSRRNDGIQMPAMRTVMLVWAGVGLGAFFLQLRGFANFLAPHKVPACLVVPAGAKMETADLFKVCPVTSLQSTFVRWNDCPTHYYRVDNGVLCHFIVPQYNTHGSYVVFNQTTPANDTSVPSCAGQTARFEGYFYHGSIGYYSIYAEIAGTYCPSSSDNTAYVTVNAVGTYDINGADLAKDGGDFRYRKSYWYIFGGTTFIFIRGFTLRRSFVSCRRFAQRCERMSEPVGIKDAVMYVQESMRLSAHGANNIHRVLLFFLLLDQGVMPDFFLLTMQKDMFGAIQSISLGYNLSTALSMLFEMVETMNWMSEKRRIQVKRLLFNFETALVGEFITAFVLHHYITALSRSRLKDTKPVAEVVSHYLMGMAGHIVLALGCLCIIIVTRVLGAIGYVLCQFGTLRVLAKTCCVDAALGSRSKFVLLTGYIWEDEELFYKPTALKALGVLKSVEPDGSEFLVHPTLDWIGIPQDNFVVLGIVSNQGVIPISERPGSGVISFFEDPLGGSTTSDPITSFDMVLPLSSRSGCCPFKRLNERFRQPTGVIPEPALAKVTSRSLNDDRKPRQALPAWEEAYRGPSWRIQKLSSPRTDTIAQRIELKPTK